MKSFWFILLTFGTILGPTRNPLSIPDTSHRWPMLQVARAAQIVRNPDEPAPFPEGVYCTHSGDMVLGVQTDHAPCACDIVFRSSNNDGCCDIQVNNDPKCMQYCHEKGCACQHRCLPPDPEVPKVN